LFNLNRLIQIENTYNLIYAWKKDEVLESPGEERSDAFRERIPTGGTAR
jgi:hypothetical protein